MDPAIVLDISPLGLGTRPPGNPMADSCKRWLDDLLAAGRRIILPEIIDYELRREVIRTRSMGSLRRLDDLKAMVEFRPITPAAMLRAADLWALIRQRGLPTADRHALDGDCILAAQALVAGEPAIIATSNVAHLARFPGVDARLWESIA